MYYATGIIILESQYCAYWE